MTKTKISSDLLENVDSSQFEGAEYKSYSGHNLFCSYCHCQELMLIVFFSKYPKQDFCFIGNAVSVSSNNQNYKGT